jgi:hypothetical protein
VVPDVSKDHVTFNFRSSRSMKMYSQHRVTFQNTAVLRYTAVKMSNLTTGITSHMSLFWTVPLSIIRSSSLYTQQWYMSYRFADSLRAGSGWNMMDRGTVQNMKSFIPRINLRN